MIVIRFLRTGKINQPFFRVVVTDKKNSARGGRFLEIVGFFNPLNKEKQLKAERIKHWISVGAQPSDRVHNLLVQDGIIKGEKIAVHAKAKKKEKKEESAPIKAPVLASTEALIEKPADNKPEGKPADKPADEKEKHAKETEAEKPAEEAKPKEKPEAKPEVKLEPKQEEKPKEEPKT